MWSVGKRITFGGRFAREFVEIVHFESEMCQIGSHRHRAALIEFAEFNFFFAAGRFEKNQLRAAAGSMPAKLLESENVFVKRDRLLQIGHAVDRKSTRLNS